MQMLRLPMQFARVSRTCQERRSTANEKADPIVKSERCSLKDFVTRFAPGGVKLYPDDNFKTCDRVAITRLAFIQNGLDDLHQIEAEGAYTLLRAIQDYELNWRSNPYIIARSFFRPGFNPTDISAREEKIMKLLISQVRGSYLVSSSKGLHYQTIEKIPEMFPMEEQTISHTNHKGSAPRPS